jgi:NhaP-type Na+/H+ or K+/H+ antiporter
MSLDFSQALLLLGILLALAGALSGWLRASVLSISVLSVAAGIALAAFDVVSVNPTSALVRHIVELALILTLFSDGLLVERELLARHWGPAARALVLAMPLTLAMLAGLAVFAFPALTVAECFLLAAVLSPTDPVVTSTVVTARRVPALVRHTLNLESGLNDGLALPLVLFFLALAEPRGHAGHAALELLGKVAVGALIGVVLAFVGGRALGRLPGSGIAESWEGVYALGLALAAYGLAEATFGNGLIAAFVAGVALGVAEHDIPDAFSRFNESVSAVLQVGVFFLFGALIVNTGWHHGIPALAGFVVFALAVARPVAVLAALAGTRLPQPVKLFIAWFGPKGVASMLFALLVLKSAAPHETLVFEIASFVIVSSIIAHGLTDTVGARWIERRLGEKVDPAGPAQA